MPTFPEAHARVCDLVETFDAGRAVYMAPDYKEAQARDDFLTPLFIALGWDVLHSSQRDPKQQEVKIEKSVVMTEGHKSADYSFALAPAFDRVHFFVEAKKPSKNLPNAEDCFQAIRYGYNVGNPIAVLTDFEDVFIMDCRAAPDKPSATSRVLGKWHYRDLLDAERFQTLFDLLSREAVANGSIENFVAALAAIPGAKGRQLRLFGQAAKPVDQTFLLQLEEWRGLLANAFLRGRPSLDASELTEVTQRALDRLVFLRFLEDKLIEPEDRVSRWTDSDAWRSFRAEAHSLNARYNGVLWREHPILDDPAFAPSGTTWADICFRISNRETPFLFNLIPIPLLGSIYERFLGNEIAVKGGKAEVEPKPEVRKAGGVYYTPEYIVSYICAHTLGPLTQGKTPAQVARLRIADISCGSGSFLLGAYDFLLRWHTAFYNDNPAAARRDKCLEDGGIFRLSLAQRRAILLNNIWGNDIDAQAVEVSKLSLYLKLLEDETDNSARQFSLDLGERVLPDLDRNIVCGNSLVDYDIDASDEERAHINPMDWQATFPAIFKSDGFDAIIGNPPWVDIKGMEPQLVRYFFENYSTVENRMNIYAVFMQKAVALLKPKGRLGYITPSSFLMQSSYTKLRKILLANQIEQIVRTPDKVFAGVTAETAVSIYSKTSPSDQGTRVVVYAPTDVIGKIAPEEAGLNATIDQSIWAANDAQKINVRFDEGLEAVLVRIEGVGKTLFDVCEFSLGLTPYDKYKGHTKSQIEGRVFHADTKLSEDFKPLLDGGDIQRYTVTWGGGSYIKYGAWLGAPREKKFFVNPRLVVRQIISGNPGRIYAGYTNDELYNTQVAFNLLAREETKESLFYLLGLINSSLMSWYHSQKFLDPGKITFQKILIQDAKKFPIRAINFSDVADKKKHDAMVSLVDKMLGAKAERARATTEKGINQSEGLIASLERRIDALVYELYGLDAAEIALVEGGSAPAVDGGASEDGEGGV